VAPLAVVDFMVTSVGTFAVSDQGGPTGATGFLGGV